MKNEQFLGNTLAEMISHGVTVQFNKRIYNSKHAYNFFDDEPKPKLYINYFDEELIDWFSVYVHEYCHFLQWKNEAKKWATFNKHIGNVNLFLDGHNKWVSKASIKKVQELELDCDKKALRQIKKFKLKVDIDEYIKVSNLYIYCHRFFPKYKKFFIPFEDELLDLMPKKHFTKKSMLKKIKGVEKLYKEAFYKEYPNL